MGNMSYCRWENTLNDLRDCQDNLLDTELSRTEAQARERLIQVCREMVADWEEAEATCDTCGLVGVHAHGCPERAGGGDE